MPFMIWAHRLNSLVCLLVGLPLNVLLVWLLFRRTSKEMRVYSQILVQTCVVDILLLVLAEVAQPVFFVAHGISHDLLVGPLHFLPNPANHIAFLCWFAVFYFSTEGLAVQFVYRYLTICRKIEIDVCKYFGLLSVAFFVNLGLTVFFGVCSYPDKTEEEVVDPSDEDERQQHQEQRWTLAIRSDMSDPLVLSWFVLLLLSNAVIYAVIILCAARIRAYLARQFVEYKLSKWAELNGQITKTLLIQALLPALPLAVCTLGICLALLAPSSSSSAFLLTKIELLITVPLSWVPVINPLITIVTVKHYRKVVKWAGRTVLSLVIFRAKDQGAGGNPAEDNNNQRTMIGQEKTKRWPNNDAKE